MDHTRDGPGASAHTSDNPAHVAIVPQPSNGLGSAHHGARAYSAQPVMPYTCRTCAKRKVKCDKAAPTCSTCLKAKLDCLYQAPPPRSRRRRLGGHGDECDVLQRLVRYESILRQHGLLDADTSSSLPSTPPRDLISLHWNEPETPTSGTLLSSEGRSRYIHSGVWRKLGDGDMQRLSDDEEDSDHGEDQAVADVARSVASDPLTGAFLAGPHGNLLQCHPSHENAMILWGMHVENVEPICKILHVPSAAKLVATVSQEPATAFKAEECLLFAVYHFAVYSTTEDACIRKLGQPRAALMQLYHHATRQALVNASFLKTTDMSVLQALVLFLMASRSCYDSQTYWVLTGVAVRIAQRMGIHRDGQKLGLPPFEVQMRRRLFYQLLPLEANACQMAGTGMPMLPDAWDALPALNINDGQMWPGMSETPQEQSGATEMIFCLARFCIGNYFVRAGKPRGTPGSSQFKGYTEAEKMINEAEQEVEEKYIRYCDVIDPLHFLVTAMARAGITAMRLRIRLPKVRSQTASNEEIRHVFRLAMKILDADAMIHRQPGLEKYRWHTRPLFLWGTWDSLILVLTSLWQCDDELLSASDAEMAWESIEKIYNNHDELLESRRALHVAFWRLTLRAWDARPQVIGNIPEPAFITRLRSRQGANTSHGPGERQIRNANSHEVPRPDLVRPTDTPVASGTDPSSESMSDVLGLEAHDDFNVDVMDWFMWDQLIQNHPA